MANLSFYKDPQAVLDYTVDWSAWLVAGDAITTSTWTVESGLTKVSDEKTTTVATVWLSGGTAGTTYTITNHIVTVGGRTDERSVYIMVVNR